jgi:hypothetical protein
MPTGSVTEVVVFAAEFEAEAEPFVKVEVLLEVVPAGEFARLLPPAEVTFETGWFET